MRIRKEVNATMSPRDSAQGKALLSQKRGEVGKDSEARSRKEETGDQS